MTRLSPLARRLVAAQPLAVHLHRHLQSTSSARARSRSSTPARRTTAHLAALLAAVAGERVSHIVVTHSHRDHAAGAALLKQRTGAPIVGARAHVAARRRAGAALDASHDARLRARRRARRRRAHRRARLHARSGRHARPRRQPSVLRASPRRTRCSPATTSWPGRPRSSPRPTARWPTIWRRWKRCARRGEAIYWPGHGGPVREPQRYVRALAHHRRQREAAILARLEAGEASDPRNRRQGLCRARARP